MAKIKQFPLLLLMLVIFCSCKAQNQRGQTQGAGNIQMGAAQWELYREIIQSKKIGVVANQTSMVENLHLVDFLLAKGVEVKKVFAPEHGFRGEAGPGDKVDSGKDAKTGLPLISLYGSRRKPESTDLSGLDYVIFDIQDVGVRFYTYISTLHYVLEACAENNIPVLVFDRPNPHGFYIDGPLLDTAYRSFVGIAPIPVVHGLTIGEYALMTNGEGWLENQIRCNLKVIPMVGYDHSKKYELPVRPSPNLPNMRAVYLYPSLCFFEGAAVSVGRGTDFPFQVYGFPGFMGGDITFTPREIAGVIKDPPYEDVACDGKMVDKEWKYIIEKRQLNLDWLITAYESFPEKEKFFNNFFDKLAGTDRLRRQIIAGETAQYIRSSWQPDLQKYRVLRNKYLLYPDK